MENLEKITEKIMFPHCSVCETVKVNGKRFQLNKVKQLFREFEITSAVRSRYCFDNANVGRTSIPYKHESFYTSLPKTCD